MKTTQITMTDSLAAAIKRAKSDIQQTRITNVEWYTLASLVLLNLLDESWCPDAETARRLAGDSRAVAIFSRLLDGDAV